MGLSDMMSHCETKIPTQQTCSRPIKHVTTRPFVASLMTQMFGSLRHLTTIHFLKGFGYAAHNIAIQRYDWFLFPSPRWAANLSEILFLYKRDAQSRSINYRLEILHCLLCPKVQHKDYYLFDVVFYCILLERLRGGHRLWLLLVDGQVLGYLGP